MVIILLLLWFTVVSFVVYMGVRHVWYSLHWISKVLLSIFWLGYPVDLLLGATVLTIYFWEIPKFNEVSISHRMKKHQHDSKLAAWFWEEITKIDPAHLK